MEKKIYLFLVIFSLFFLASCRVPIQVPEDAQQCGELAEVEDTPEKILCFVEAFKNCQKAVIGRTRYTYEGDPIIKTWVIEGLKKNQCRIHAYFDNYDAYSPNPYEGTRHQYCYGLDISSENNQIRLELKKCSKEGPETTFDIFIRGDPESIKDYDFF